MEESSSSLGSASVSILDLVQADISPTKASIPCINMPVVLETLADSSTVIAFLSWYAFPPLLPHTIKKDLHLSQNEIANSNIIALTAT